jgi:biotin carboxyl carrier protein
LTIEIELEGRRHLVQVRRAGTGWAIELDGRPLTATVAEAGGRWSLLFGHRSYEVAFEPRAGGTLVVHVNGEAIPLSIIDADGRLRRPPADARRVPSPVDERGGDDARAGHAGPAAVSAPMPGRVVKVLVSPGDQVSARQGVIVVEAMKMENELRAPRSGTVKEIRVVEGASVEAGAVLMVLA